MSSMSSLAEAVEFFTAHAGYSFDPATETPEQGKRRAGLRLAEAEAWAAREGVEFAWEDDWAVDHAAEFDCYEDGGPESCEAVTAYRNGEIVASLGCVDDADGDYRRVVEAELALEAMAEVTFR